MWKNNVFENLSIADAKNSSAIADLSDSVRTALAMVFDREYYRRYFFGGKGPDNEMIGMLEENVQPGTPLSEMARIIDGFLKVKPLPRDRRVASILWIVNDSEKDELRRAIINAINNKEIKFPSDVQFLYLFIQEVNGSCETPSDLEQVFGRLKLIVEKFPGELEDLPYTVAQWLWLNPTVLEMWLDKLREVYEEGDKLKRIRNPNWKIHQVLPKAKPDNLRLILEHVSSMEELKSLKDSPFDYLLLELPTSTLRVFLEFFKIPEDWLGVLSPFGKWRENMGILKTLWEKDIEEVKRLFGELDERWSKLKGDEKVILLLNGEVGKWLLAEWYATFGDYYNDEGY